MTMHPGSQPGSCAIVKWAQGNREAFSDSVQWDSCFLNAWETIFMFSWTGHYWEVTPGCVDIFSQSRPFIALNTTFQALQRPATPDPRRSHERTENFGVNFALINVSCLYKTGRSHSGPRIADKKT